MLFINPKEIFHCDLTLAILVYLLKINVNALVVPDVSFVSGNWMRSELERSHGNRRAWNSKYCSQTPLVITSGYFPQFYDFELISEPPNFIQTAQHMLRCEPFNDA